MNLKTLLDTPPWEWPGDAGKVFHKYLINKQAKPSDRLIAAELAGDLSALNDDLVADLLTIIPASDEPDDLRSRAAISLGPMLEQVDLLGFDDPDLGDLPITEDTFKNIQETLRTTYADTSVPKEVRRRI